jgi:diguanylate cyclase (GGDEF)-like protein/PAS domain S-box-containing protein
MNTPLRALIIEDSSDDLELLVHYLRTSGFDLEYACVDTAAAMQAALELPPWDVVLSDHAMPRFSIPAALEILRERELDVPFIIVSGGIGEEAAAALMKTGAHDYILKDNLARLAPAIQRETREAEARRSHRRAEATLRAFYDSAPMMMGIVAVYENDVWQVSYNAATARFFKVGPDTLLNRPATQLGISRAMVDDWIRFYREAERTGQPVNFQYPHPTADGVFWLSSTAAHIAGTNAGRALFAYVVEDITERKQAEDEIRRLNAELEGRVAERTAQLAAANRKLESEIDQHKQAEAALRDSEVRLRSIVETAADGIIVIDARGHIEAFNPAAERLFGFTAGEMLGQSVKHLMPAPECNEHDGYIARYLTTGVKRILGVGREVRGQRRDGSVFPIELMVTEMHIGGERKFTGMVRDISKRKQAEAALQQANEQLQAWVNELEARNRESRLLGEMGDMLQACRTAKEAYSIVMQSMPQLFPGLSGALYIAKSPPTLVEAVAVWGESGAELEQSAFAPDECWALRRSRAHWVDEAHPGPHCPHVEAHRPYLCAPLIAQAETLGLLYLQSSAPGSGAAEALGDKERLAMTAAEHIALALSNLNLRETLRSQAIRDPLTNLFNRRYMEESLERELRRVRRKQAPLSVIMLDVDHFKRFNDTFGHDGGDSLLRHLGSMLQSSVRGEDIACRYGGEEFILILPEAPLAVAHQRAEQVREKAKHMRVEHLGQSLEAVTLSLGVASSPEHGATGEAIIHAADTALYRAKHEGRDRVVVGP